MVGRDVEHLEVRDVGLDLGSLVGHEAELAEDLGDPRDGLDDRMEGPARDDPGRRGDVDRLRGQARLERRRAGPPARLHERRLDRLAHLVHDHADPRPILDRQRADPAHEPGQRAALATEVVQVELVERRKVGCPRDAGQGLVAERTELGGQGREVHGGERRLHHPGRESRTLAAPERARVPLRGRGSGRSRPCRQALRATSTILPNVASSRTARSARIFRSSTMSAFFRPAMSCA